MTGDRTADQRSATEQHVEKPEEMTMSVQSLPEDETGEDIAVTDPAVQATLEENHRDFLIFLTRRVGNRDEAEEVLQNFYLKALDKAHELRNAETAVAWLYRVLRTTLIDHYRKRTREANAMKALALEAQAVGDPDVALQAEICRCVYSLLPVLPDRYAQLIWRIDLAGEPRAAVASSLGITLNNLGVRLHRARLALKEALLLSCTTCPDHGFDDCGCERRSRRPSE